MNADGAVVEEGVYWPALPAAALAGAGDIAGVLADPRRRQVLAARVASGSAATVAIRHTAATTDQAFAAMASYDVVVRPGEGGDASASGTSRPAAGMSFTRHFDASGREFRLPQEAIGGERARAPESAGVPVNGDILVPRMG